MNTNPLPAKRTWQADFLASLVVFLVALPLCMGIALASGAPVAAGLVTGIVGGLVVGTIAGSPLQVSGPAAGLTVICADVIRQHGMGAFGLVILFAGALQLVAGICRLGQWFRAVSPAVIHGMLSGIGVLILCGQIHVLIDERPKENAVKNILAFPESVLMASGLPEWEPEDVRTVKIDLLRRLNALSNEQRSLKGDVDRALLRTMAGRSSDPFAAESELTAPDLSGLKEFVPAQQKVIENLRSIGESLRLSPLASSAQGQKLLDITAAAESAVDLAASRLNGSSVRDVARSQKAAADSINALAGALKSHEWAGKIGLIAVVVIFAWQFLARGKLKLLPAPLLAIIISTSVAILLHAPVLYVDVPNNLFSGMTFPNKETILQSDLKAVAIAAMVLAIVASAETLLCATAVDQMHRGARTRYDKELRAQGVGNILCGFMGVLPMTGVIVRSAANVQAGGTTRLSAILHGGWLLLFSVALAPVLRLIPTAALAGILVYTGFRLIDFKGFIHLWKENRFEAAIFVITLVVIVVDDLLTGVVTGIVLSAIKLLIRFSSLELELDVKEVEGHPDVRLILRGAATFLRLPLLAARLEKIPAGAHLHVDVSELDYIDRACLELLQNWARQHASSGGQLTLDWETLNSHFQRGRRRTPQAAPLVDPTG
ncbi:MAG: SulP family inorganic anion transporter [Planctomycetaceae bacterium]|nr:SulP family inorganic anion transporter [Planctomycetaceae bacterium]